MDQHRLYACKQRHHRRGGGVHGRGAEPGVLVRAHGRRQSDVHFFLAHGRASLRLQHEADHHPPWHIHGSHRHTLQGEGRRHDRRRDDNLRHGERHDQQHGAYIRARVLHGRRDALRAGFADERLDQPRQLRPLQILFARHHQVGRNARRQPCSGKARLRWRPRRVRHGARRIQDKRRQRYVPWLAVREGALDERGRRRRGLEPRELDRDGRRGRDGGGRAPDRGYADRLLRELRRADHDQRHNQLRARNVREQRDSHGELRLARARLRPQVHRFT